MDEWMRPKAEWMHLRVRRPWWHRLIGRGKWYDLGFIRPVELTWDLSEQGDTTVTMTFEGPQKEPR